MTLLIYNYQLNEIRSLCNRFMFIDKEKLVKKIK